MGSGISWASRSANVSNEEWDKRWEETFGSGLKKGKKKGREYEKVKNLGRNVSEKK